MNDAEIPQDKKRRLPVLFRIIILIFGFLLLTYIAVFFGLNYFGEKLLRNYLKERIAKTSKGLYDVDFGELNLNLLTGKVTIHDFKMVPDTLLYNEMKKTGLIRKALYRFSFQSVSVDRLHFIQIYSQHRIKLRQIDFQAPVISIVGFPDTVTARKSRWRVIYEDIYPMISQVFSDFHVDSVTINRGLLLTSFRQKTGKLAVGEYEFSSILRDVSINPFSYYNHDRVFYSRDIDWIIHNLELSIGDSLYFLKADQIGFSLNRSELWGKRLSLIPNFPSPRLKKATTGDFFQVDIPEFLIKGVDLYNALVEKNVEIKNVQLNDIRFKMFRNIQPFQTNTVKKEKKKFRTAGIYTIIAGALKSVSIDSFSIQKASFEYFRSLNDPNPELRIAEVNLDLSNFFLDSLAYREKHKIYFSDNIELQVRNISLKLRDEVHFLNAEEIRFSTERSLIDVSYVILFPDKKVNQQSKTGRKNLISCLLPSLIFKDVDLYKVFNDRILEFDLLKIMEPEVEYAEYHKSKNPDPRFKLPEDFFQEENEEIIYDLLKKYLRIIKGNSIEISSGQIQLKQHREERERKTASGSFDLVMKYFLMDSIHGMNRQGYFYSRDFTLDVKTLFYESPDSSKHLEIEKLHVNTIDSLIEAHNGSFKTTTGSTSGENLKNKKPASEYDFTFKDLKILGLNHKKLFLKKVLRANTIILEQPNLHIEAGKRSRHELQSAKLTASRSLNFPRTFEIGKLLVRNGALSFDGHEQQKVTYFSLKDVDFGVTGAMVHIPEKGQTDGLIRFDSLRLSVFPINIILSDSSYSLQSNSLRVYSYPADLIATGVKIIPLKQTGSSNKPDSHITLTIPILSIKDFYFDKAIFNKQWYMDEVTIYEPDLLIEERNLEKSNITSGKTSLAQHVKLPPFINSLNVGKFIINNGSVCLKTAGKDKMNSYSLSDIHLTADRLLIDSLTLSYPEKYPIFFCEDLTFMAGGYKWIPNDSMYTFSFDGIGFSTHEQQAYVDSFKMTPNFSKFDFCRKVGHQIDRFDLKVPRITFDLLDFRKLVENREVDLGRIAIERMTLESYRDKRIPFPQDNHPLLPAAMVKTIKTPVNVDSVVLIDGKIIYQEQTGEKPGMIFFDRTNVTLINLSTDTLKWDRPMIINGTSYLMGKAFMGATFQIPMNYGIDTFSITASIGEVDLKDINPMLSNLLPVKIRKGMINKTEIKQINANDDFSKGYMVMHFQDLNIELQNTKPGTLNEWETALKTLVVNWILPDSNPKDDGKIRQGFIYYERNKSKGFFNFVWKSTLSGIKSSVGLNSKEQKELKKINRKNPQ